MRADTQTAKTAKTKSQTGMTFLGLDAETSARYANIFLIFLGAVGALVGAFAYRWGDQAQAQKDMALSVFQGESRIKIANLEIEASKQQERAAKAEKELLEIQERARPRTVSDAARSALIGFGGATAEEPISIKFISGSVVEPVNFARELKDALSAAGWTITSVTGGPSLGRPAVGLVIQHSRDESPPRSASILKAALESAGLPATMEARPDMKPPSVVLMVGLKP